MLVIGPSGGLGSYAVQLATAFGADVTGVCRITKAELLRSLGTDYVIDYKTEDFADGSRRYDLILDIAGNPGLSRPRCALAPAGTAVIVGGEEGGSCTRGIGRQLVALILSPFLRQRLVMLTPKQRASDLKQLTEVIEGGTVTPSIDTIYPLEQVREAIRDMAAGQARGKVVITTESGGHNPHPDRLAPKEYEREADRQRPDDRPDRSRHRRHRGHRQGNRPWPRHPGRAPRHHRPGQAARRNCRPRDPRGRGRTGGRVRRRPVLTG